MIKRMLKHIETFINENIKKPDTTYTPSGRERCQFIDLAKGLCIILVVLHHCTFYLEDLPWFITTKNLRIPLYFILSGIFFKDYGGILKNVEKKINKLIIPFCFFIVVYLLAVKLPLYLGGKTDSVFGDFITQFPINPPLWFLIVLFFDNIIYYYMQKYLKRMVYILPTVIGLTCLAYYMDRIGVKLPLYISQICVGLFYYTIGRMLTTKTQMISTQDTNRFRTLITGIIIFATGIIIFRTIGNGARLEVYNNEWKGNPVWIIAMSLLMTIGTLLISKSIRWLPILSYMGRYSIIILGLHYVYIMLLDSFTTLPSYLFVTTVLLLSWLSIPIFKSVFPRYTAQGELIKLPTRYATT